VFLALYLVALGPVLVLGVVAGLLHVSLSRAIQASAFYKTEYRLAPIRRAFNHYEACLTDRIYFKETRTTGAVPFFRHYVTRLSNHTIGRCNSRSFALV
jgi:ATP-binding cassette subfamily B protein